MSLDEQSLRAVVAGVVGGIIAMWVCSRVSPCVPTRHNRETAVQLLQENRWSIRIANLSFFLGLCLGIAAYRLGYFDSGDWRGFALGGGGGCLCALLSIPMQARLAGRDVSEAFAAFAMSQRTPPLLLYGVLALGVGGFCAAGATFFS